MLKKVKQQRRQFRNSFQDMRQKVAARSPGWMRRFLGPALDYLDMLLIDHGIFRVIYPNRYQIAPGVWRASQPAPHQIRRYARQGIKTIVNLRGPRNCGSYRLETETCAAHGIELVNFQVKSRAAPSPEVVLEAEKLFARLEYPILLHCKSGADRVGLASALYLLLHEKRPVEDAMKQLDWRYGHFKQADTGVLDHFFEVYQEQNAIKPQGFHDWLESDYQPEEVHRSFHSRGWANAIVNRILRRE